MTSKANSQPHVTADMRYASPENRFGLRGIDHVGIPCRDPELSGRFVEEVLGGKELMRHGYTDADRAAGRLRHIFYHVGSQQVEVVEQEDKKSYPNEQDENTQPHWSFGASAAGLAKFVQHLKEQGIPFNGPRSHLGNDVVSVYFRDIDGNKLEVTTWEKIPPGLIETRPMGGEQGYVTWSKLVHKWRPRS